MPWLLYAILSPAFYSVSNYGEKFLIDKKIANPLAVTIFYGILYCILGVTILMIHGFTAISIPLLIAILIGGIFLNLYLVPYFMALKIDEASRIVPLFQFIPLFTLLLSYLFLGESLTGKKLLGFGIVVIGGFILAAERIDKMVVIPRKSFWYMMLASLLYAVSVIIFKHVVGIIDFWSTFSYEAFGSGIGAVLLLSIPKQRKSFISIFKKISVKTIILIAGNEGFTFLADSTGSFAVSLASPALVTAIGGLQPLFVLLFGIILSRWFPKIVLEDISRATLLLKGVAISIICFGIYYISN